MRTMLHTPRKAPRRAAVALEFALILPLILGLSLVVTDLSRIVYYRIAVAASSRAAATAGAIHRFTPFTQAAWNAAVREAAEESLQERLGENAADADVDVQVQETQPGRWRVRVRVGCQFSTITSWPGLAIDTQIASEATFLQFR